jgi:4-carboxymuconolactone decarboxylase
MPDRYVPIPPSQLDPERRAAYDECSKTAEQLFGHKGFLYQDSEGAFIGPFAPLIYTPNLLKIFFQLLLEVAKVPDFPAKAKETAILAVGSHFNAAYEMYAHGRIAGTTRLLTDGQIDSIKKGIKPSGGDALEEQCEVAFDCALELAKGGVTLSESNWDRSQKVFGRKGTAALIHYIAVYAYTCVLLNGVDASVPTDLE